MQTTASTTASSVDRSSSPGATAQATSAGSTDRRELRKVDYAAGAAMLTPPEDEAPPSVRDPAALLAVRRDVVKRDIEAEYEEQARIAKAYGKAVDALDEQIETEQDKSRKKALEAKKAELVPIEEAARDKAARAAQDLQLLEPGPGTSPAEVDAMLARRGAGEATTTERKPTTKVDLDGASATSTDTTTHVKGPETKATTKKETTSFDFAKGDITHETGREDRVTKDGKATGTASSSSTTITADGASRKQTHTRFSGKDGKDKDTSESTWGATAKKDELGVNAGSTRKREGADGASSSSTVEGGASAFANKDGVGVRQNVGLKGAKTTAGGYQVGGGAAASGKASFSIMKGDDGKYRVTISIALGASAEVSGGKGWGDDAASAKGKAHVGGNVTASFGQVLDEAGVEQWKASLRAAESGSAGREPEFQIIATGVKQGWPAARDLYERMRGDKGAIASMQEGQEMRFGGDAEVGGGVEAGGKGPNTNVGVSVEAKAKREVEVVITKTAKALVASCKIVDTLSGGVGGSVGYGGVGMKGKVGASGTTGGGYQFTIPDDYPNAAGLAAQVASITTRSALDAFAAKHADLMSARTDVKGSGRDDSVGVNVGPLGIDLESSGSATHTQTNEYDPETGELVRQSDNHKGEGRLGGKVTLPGGTTIGSAKKETLDTTVVRERDADGNWVESASSDAMTEENDTSIDAEGTLDNLAKNPGALFGGNGKVLATKEKKAVAGFFMDDDDIMRIAALARDEGKWNGSLVKGDLDAWAALGAEIRAARGDREQIAAALSKYKKETGGVATNKNIENLIDVRSGKAGDRYELPDGLSPLKDEYGALVVNSPFGSIDKLVSEKKYGDAAGAAEALASRCGSLLAKINANRAEFKDASIYQEMVRRIGARQTELELKAFELAAKAQGKEVSPELFDRVKASKRFNQLLDYCKDQKAKETQVLGKISELRNATFRDEVAVIELVNQLRRNVPDWKKAHLDLASIEQIHHIAIDASWKQLGPDEARIALAYQGGDPQGDDADRAADEAQSQAAFAGMAAADQKRVGDNMMTSIHGTRKAEGVPLNAPPAKAWLDRLPGMWTGLERSVAAARASASNAKGKCNKLTSDGTWDKVAAPAKRPYNQGYAAFAKAESLWRQAQATYPTAAKSGDRCLSLGSLAEAQFRECIARFQEGDRLQG